VAARTTTTSAPTPEPARTRPHRDAAASAVSRWRSASSGTPHHRGLVPHGCSSSTPLGTNVVADRAAHKQATRSATAGARRFERPGALDTKDGIGFLHVPSMKNGEVLVEKGTATGVLNDGRRLLQDPSSRPADDRQGRQLHARRAPRRPRRQVPQHRQGQEGRPDRLRTKDDWYVYKSSRSPETSKFNVKVPSRSPSSPANEPGHYITLTPAHPSHSDTVHRVGRTERGEVNSAGRRLPSWC